MSYWTEQDGHVVVVPIKENVLPEQERLQLCHLFRERQIYNLRFVLSVRPETLLQELACPKTFQTTTSNYYVFSVEDVKNNITWKSPDGHVIWNGTQLLKSNEKLCGECFLNGAIQTLDKCAIHFEQKNKIREDCIEQASSKAPKRKRKYRLCVCGSSEASFNLPDQKPAIWCALCPQRPYNAINVKNKRCSCGKACPSFNLPGEKTAIWCSQCPEKAKNAVDVCSLMCECGRGRANFNIPGTTRPVWCKMCPKKPSNAVNIMRQKCLCGRATPIFAIQGETKKIWCALCPSKPSTAIDMRNTQCFCGKGRPLFNLQGQTKSIWCGSCKAVDAVDVINRQCLCGRSRPSFNLPGQIKPIWCASCPQRPENAVDVVNKKCACNTQATYGIVGLQSTCCAKCKTPEMVLHPKKRCKSCKQLAIYGLSSRERCEDHKKDTDLNLVEQKCDSCGLFCVLNADKKCFACDPNNFQKFAKRKENQVKALLDANNLVYVHDKIPNGTLCGKERPDFVFRCGNHIVILEVDENQHSNYQCLCEQVRMINVTQTFGGMPVMWIRYNPDKFKAKNAKKKREISENKRHACLLKWLRWAFEKNMENLAEVIYLCYDECDETSHASEVFVLPSI